MSQQPFSVAPVSTFNRFSTDEMINAFIGGAIVLVILVELSNIFRAVLCGTAALDKRAIDRYSIFERLADMRHLLPVLTGRESPVHYHTDMPPNIVQQNAPISRNFSVLCIPTLAAVLLLSAEFASIYAGTTTPFAVTARTNFDPVLALSTRAQRTSQGIACDDFFVPSRGLRQGAQVLKCVTNSSVPHNAHISSAEARISLKSSINSNTHMMLVQTGEEMESAVHISIEIRSIGQGAQHMGVFRWDIDSNYTLAVFNGIINGTLELLDLAPDSNVRYFSGMLQGTRDISYSRSMDRSGEQITAALVKQLRRMDIVLNSTGAPWVFVREDEYERREKLTVGIQVYNRVPQGVLLILAIILVALRTIVNMFFTSFDEVAYMAMKEIIGDDCVLGPLAANSGLTAQEVKPCYQTGSFVHDHDMSRKGCNCFQAGDELDTQGSESRSLPDLT